MLKYKIWRRDSDTVIIVPAVDHIVLDVLGMLVVAQVAVHLGLHQEKPDGGGGELDGPGDQPDDAGNDEDAVPEP